MKGKKLFQTVGIVWVLCSLAFAVSACGETETEEIIMDQKDAENTYSRSSTVRDVINDPCFEDFGRLLFPVDRSVPEDMTLEEVSSGSVYVWYNYIDPDKTVEIIQSLHDHAAAGEQIFYDIYSEEDREADPSKRDTGLFFFRGNPGEKFAVVNAGGGFMYVGVRIEAFLVPGHTWGHMVYLVDDAYLFTGDTIWFGADGGYSFINSLAEDNDLAKRALAALEGKLRGRGLSPKVITGHTGWSDDLDFVFAHKDQVCNSMKKQKPHDPSAPYDGYDERDDTEDKARRTRLASADSRQKRKVLVFGAGVIGSYLAHVLCKAGNEVTVLAREARADSLNKNGLVIRHHLQGKVTKDRVEAVTSVEGRTFDAVFVVMPYHKLKAALPEIAKLKTKLLVLVGNDVTPAEIEKHIKENAPGVKKILFGFQATGGKKEEDRYICERLGGGMDIGQLHGETNPKIKKWVRRMFEGTDYKLNWQGDMESYLLCHVAAILPIGYLTYICGGDLRSSTGEQRKMMLEASHEAYEFLKDRDFTVYPLNDDKYFEKGIRGGMMSFLYFAMAKTKIGDLAACEHCRNAVSEMEQLDLFYEKLMEGYPAEKLKTWRKLRSQMPSWEELHRTYEN